MKLKLITVFTKVCPWNHTQTRRTQ